MYPTPRERKERGRDRCWPTQAPAIEILDSGRRHSAVSFVLADPVSLSLGTLVWFARLFIRLLVRIQNEGCAFCGLYHSDRLISKRDFPAH